MVFEIIGTPTHPRAVKSLKSPVLLKVKKYPENNKFVSTGDEKEERENPLYGACFDARQDEYATVNKANKGKFTITWFYT